MLDSSEPPLTVWISSQTLGTETLKNLILPGIGQVTIIDDQDVKERDLGNNFFYEPSDFGQPRHSAALKHLLELNEDVKGQSEHGSTTSVLGREDRLAFVSSFSLIVACEISETEARELGKLCQETGTTLLVIRSYGLIAYLRVQAGEHAVMQAKIDENPEDLRIHSPFEELQKIVDSYDLENQEGIDHSHTPYVVILTQAIYKWKTEKGSIPKTFAEKDEFKTILKGMARASDEICYQEAITNAYKAYATDEVPFELQEILDNERVKSPKSKFWVFVAALKAFIDQKKTLPVSGKVTDMTAKTDYYISLQNCYRTKAEEDRSLFKELAQTVISAEELMFEITDEEVRIFCENVATKGLEVTHYRTIDEEFTNPNIDEISGFFYDPESSLPWLIAIKAQEAFNTKNGRYAGTTEEWEADVPQLKELATGIVESLGGESVDEKYLQEM